MTRQRLLTTLKQQRQLLPLILLTGFCIEAIIAVLLNYSILTTKNYIAFGVVVVNFLTYFLFRQFYKYTLTVTLTVGLFNFIVFSAGEWTTSFSLNSLKISFQPHSFLAGLLAYIINFKRVNEFIVDNLATKQTPEEQERSEKTRFTEGVEKFKGKYESYSTETLTEIITANKYMPEALEAARQLINERQPNQNAN